MNALYRTRFWRLYCDLRHAWINYRFGAPAADALRTLTRRKDTP